MQRIGDRKDCRLYFAPLVTGGNPHHAQHKKDTSYKKDFDTLHNLSPYKKLNPNANAFGHNYKRKTPLCKNGIYAFSAHPQKNNGQTQGRSPGLQRPCTQIHQKRFRCVPSPIFPPFGSERGQAFLRLRRQRSNFAKRQISLFPIKLFPQKEYRAFV